MDRSQFIGLFWQQPKVQQVAELQELNIGDQLPNKELEQLVGIFAYASMMCLN